MLILLASHMKPVTCTHDEQSAGASVSRPEYLNGLIKLHGKRKTTTHTRNIKMAVEVHISIPEMKCESVGLPMKQNIQGHAVCLQSDGYCFF